MSREADRLGKEIIERTVSALVDLVDAQRELLESQRAKLAQLSIDNNALRAAVEREEASSKALREACDAYAAELKALKSGKPAPSNVALIAIAPQSIQPSDVIRLNIKAGKPQDYRVESITQEYGDKGPTFCVLARNVATGQPFLRTFKRDECIVSKVVEATGMTPETGAPVSQAVNVGALQPGNVVIKGGFGSAHKAREVTVISVRGLGTVNGDVEVTFFEPKHGRYSRRYSSTARFMRVTVDGNTKQGPTA